MGGQRGAGNYAILTTVRVARFFLAQLTKTGKMYQNGNQMPNGHEIKQSFPS
jgi:hypothetical protein